MPPGSSVCRLQSVGEGRDEMVALLRQAPLFAGLPDAALSRLAAGAMPSAPTADAGIARANKPARGSADDSMLGR